MPGPSPAQGVLKRLIEAEEQAREILKSAEQRAGDAVAQARAQAKESIDAVRQEAAALLQSRLEEAESQGSIDRQQRLDRAEAEAREFERRANANLSQAVEMVVAWITNREDRS